MKLVKKTVRLRPYVEKVIKEEAKKRERSFSYMCQIILEHWIHERIGRTK